MAKKPDIIIVSDINLLPVFDPVKFKAVMLSGSRGTPLKEYGAQQDISDVEFYLQLTDNGTPTRVRMGTGTDASRRADLARILAECGKTMDLLEPLGRVETAVRTLWDEIPENQIA